MEFLYQFLLNNTHSSICYPSWNCGIALENVCGNFGRVKPATQRRNHFFAKRKLNFVKHDENTSTHYSSSTAVFMKTENIPEAGYTLFVKYEKTILKCKKRKWIARYFASLFSHFPSLFSLFVFHSISRHGRHSCEKLKDLVVYFFAALIKHEIHMKYEKYIVNVSYFMVCFVKIMVKYPQNVKYENCIAGLTTAKKVLCVYQKTAHFNECISSWNTRESQQITIYTLFVFHTRFEFCQFL